MSLRATLYAKPGCHLCEQALGELERLRRRYPHELQVVDISADAELTRRYGERIPVLNIAGHESEAPLSAAVLERALRRANAS
ncbi:MAG: glutaredoxin family protein [Chloroflexi bacterium]|nr:MAG: glutaredoxin family protein [Chloroflexota bacterium]